MKNLILAIILVVAGNSFVLGQQTPDLEHYLANPYFYNPASAGVSGTKIFLDYHKQWSDFSGAPETQLFTFDKSFKKDKYGLGFKLINDEVNILGRTGGYLSYSYQFKIGKVQSIRFGLEAGFLQNRVLFDKIIAEDNTESLIFSNKQNSTNFDGAAGFIYTIQGFTLGFSAQNLIPSNFHYENTSTSNELVYRNIHHYYLNAMYDIKLGESKWLIQPSILAKSAKGLPFVFDGNITTKFDDMAWLTLRYKHKVGYSAGIGAVIANQVTIGYAYGISSNEISKYNTGTHEVILGINILGGQGGSGTKIPNKRLDKLEQQNNELYEKTDYLEKQNESLKSELEKQKEELKNKVFGLDELKLELTKELEEWKASQKNQSSNSNVNTESNINLNANSASEELGQESLKENGDKFVVIGATKTIKSAKKYQTIIAREYKETTMIVRNDAETWYLIYTVKTRSVEDAQKELKRVKKIDTKSIYVGKPWIYSVQD